MFRLEEFIPFVLNLTAHSTSTALSGRQKMSADISVAEWRVLVHLQQRTNLSVRDLSKAIALDRVAVTRAGASLIKKNLVQKTQNSQDNRLVEFCLTDSGKSAVENLIQIAINTEKEMLSGINKEEKIMFLKTLEKIIKNCDQIRTSM